MVLCFVDLRTVLWKTKKPIWFLAFLLAQLGFNPENQNQIGFVYGQCASIDKLILHQTYCAASALPNNLAGVKYSARLWSNALFACCTKRG
jgi:hypothetical protein